MPARTNDFQRLIAVVQSHLDPGSTVAESQLLSDISTGTKREVDIVVSGKVGSQPVLVSIECRDRRRSPDVTWIDEMQTKHSRLPTNVLVLVSHNSFTSEALRIATLYGIRCLLLNDVDAAAPDRLFPDVQSLWGKAWELTLDRVTASVEASEGFPAERVRLLADNKLFLDDETELGTAAQLVDVLIRCQPVIENMAREARPEHTFMELSSERPILDGKRICLQKLVPLILRPIETLRIVAKCTVTVDEFPLRHGKFGAVRVAWGRGAILGKPAMLVATDDSSTPPKISIKMIPDEPKNGE
jgi:hypothetical protein